MVQAVQVMATSVAPYRIVDDVNAVDDVTGTLRYYPRDPLDWQLHGAHYDAIVAQAHTGCMNAGGTGGTGLTGG